METQNVKREEEEVEKEKEEEEGVVEEKQDALVVSTGAIDLLRELKGLASELENAKSNVKKVEKTNDDDNDDDENGVPPPVPDNDDINLDEEDNSDNILREQLVHQEALVSSLRETNEIHVETNSRQKAALVALQISLKEEIELARSKSSFRDIREEEAMAQLLESQKQFSELDKRDVLVRSVCVCVYVSYFNAFLFLSIS
jgi:hypothetical protein